MRKQGITILDEDVPLIRGLIQTKAEAQENFHKAKLEVKRQRAIINSLSDQSIADKFGYSEKSIFCLRKGIHYKNK